MQQKQEGGFEGLIWKNIYIYVFVIYIIHIYVFGIGCYIHVPSHGVAVANF